MSGSLLELFFWWYDESMKLFEWIRHFFIPRCSNNHKAKILHPSTLAVLVALFLIGQFLLNFSALFIPSVLGFASNITPEQVIELTNQKRIENGLEPLRNNPKLNEAAQRKAGDMFAFDYWAHQSPSGRSPWSFFHEVGYRYLYAGENLARDFMDAGSVVEAWMNSPTHRDNILNSKYQEIGLAVVNGTLNGVETTLVVQLFGTAMAVPVRQVKPHLGPATTTTAARAILAQATGKETRVPSILSPFLLTKTIAIFLLGIIFGALSLDIFWTYRKKIVRLSGRNLAHFIFISILLLAVILTSQGAIL